MLTELFFGIGPEDVRVSFDSALDDDGDGLVDADANLLELSSWEVHPQFKMQTFGGGATDTHDIALLILKEPAPGVTPAVLPEAGFLDELAAAGELQKGNPATTFVAVGYGIQELQPPQGHAWDGLRNMSIPQYQELLRSWLLLNQVHSNGKSESARTSQGSCSGDSGGPGFWVEDDGTEVLIGIESWGDIPCVATAFKYRLDTEVSLSFIESVTDGLE